LDQKFGGRAAKKLAAQKQNSGQISDNFRTSSRISRMEQNIVERKTALQTAISPAYAI